MKDVQWLDGAQEEGRWIWRIGRGPSGLVAEWAGIGSFDAGRNPRFLPDQEADPRLVLKIRQGAVNALERESVGKFTLHASAVTRDARGIALVGSSGAGKSTLAAYLCEHRQFAFVADDVVGVEMPLTPSQPSLLGSESHHWLRAEGRRMVGVVGEDEKSPAPPRSFERHAPLTAVISLAVAPIAAPTLTRLRGRQAMLSILSATYSAAPLEKAAYGRDFETIENLCRFVAVFRLERSESASIEAVADRVEGLWQRP